MILRKLFTVQPLDPDDKDPNNHLDIFGSVEADKPIKSVIKSKEYALPDVRAITFSPDDLAGRTFLKQPEEDGIRDRSPSRGLGDVYKRQP